MLKLTVRFGGEHVKTYNLDDDTVVIGRDPDCTVHIDNLGVSRKHAKIENEGSVYVLKRLLQTTSDLSFTVTDQFSVDGGPFRRLGNGSFFRGD